MRTSINESCAICFENLPDVTCIRSYCTVYLRRIKDLILKKDFPDVLKWNKKLHTSGTAPSAR